MNTYFDLQFKSFAYIVLKATTYTINTFNV